MQESEYSTKPIFNYATAAKYLGIAESTLRIWNSKQKLPHYKLGKLVRFSELQLQEILQKCEVGK